MRTDNKKFSFAVELKASNIEINGVSLDEYSKQIELLLDQIDVGGDKVAKYNLESSKKAVVASRNVSPMGRINEYVKLGEQLQFLISGLKNTNNKRFLKQIAICYLDIAKLINDEKVKNLSFAVADRLIDNDD